MSVGEIVAVCFVLVALCFIGYSVCLEAKAVKAKEAKEAALERMYVALAERLAVTESVVFKTDYDMGTPLPDHDEVL